MKLSTKTQYAVRAVFDMAYFSESDTVLAKDVAARQDIPLRYLEQIFQDLKRAGIVDAKRGPKGGYTLRKAARDLRLGDVVRATEGPVEAWEVFEDGGPKASELVTSPLWREFASAMAGWFDAITFADLVERAAAQGVPRTGAPAMYFI